ncbi:NlpC/P60 family protein [Paraburkholderia unamae]|uniref:NlpC/P60 family protein n=1 Tax=Paraburkholderia unamae TaxID=219649 RepID=A0ABX5KIP2_9BURK|nr:NlpC/P60 family protein [Paraburkholderia unamae]PVX81287.1 NlpC/P60 family protein [Paraburkholderia unamae]
MDTTSERDRIGNNRERIAKKAQDLLVKLKESKYLHGGKSETAFDCSYFVYLVFSDVFSDYKYMDSDAIVSSPLFAISQTPKVGDVIYFPAGEVPYTHKTADAHVGIVLDQQYWCGRQTHGGLAMVSFNNPWWGSRKHQFYSFKRFDASHAINSAGYMRKYFA